MEIRAKEFRFPEVEELKKLEDEEKKEPSKAIRDCYAHVKRLPQGTRFEREVYKQALKDLYEETALPKDLTFNQFRKEVEEVPKLLFSREGSSKERSDLERSLETRKELVKYAPFLVFKVGIVPRGGDPFTFYLLESRGKAWIDEEANIVYKILCCDEREPMRFPNDVLVHIVQRARNAIKALKEKRKIGYEVALENYARPIVGEDEKVGASVSQKCPHCERDSFIQLAFDVKKWLSFQRKFVGE